MEKEQDLLMASQSLFYHSKPARAGSHEALWQPLPLGAEPNPHQASDPLGQQSDAAMGLRKHSGGSSPLWDSDDILKSFL